MKVMVIPIVIGALGTILKRLGKDTGRLRNQRASRDHPDYTIIKIGQNTETSPRDLPSLTLQWLTLVWKITTTIIITPPSLDYGVIKIIQLFSECSTLVQKEYWNWHAGWGTGTAGNCARKWNFTILTSKLYTQKP